jgi:hypothetical protein
VGWLIIFHTNLICGHCRFVGFFANCTTCSSTRDFIFSGTSSVVVLFTDHVIEQKSRLGVTQIDNVYYIVEDNQTNLIVQ